MNSQGLLNIPFYRKIEDEETVKDQSALNYFSSLMAEGGIIQKQDRVRPLLPPKPTGCFPTHHPAGTTAGLKSMRTVTRGSSSGANYSQKNSTFKETTPTENSPEAGKSSIPIKELKKQYECRETKDVALKKCGEHEVCEEKCNRKPFSPKKQVLTRPQIFPKPQTPIKSKKAVVKTEPASPQNCAKLVVSETAAEECSETIVQKVKVSSKRILSSEKCQETKNLEEVCVKTDTVSGSEVDSYHALHIRAPVANFEEFDCLPESDRSVPVRPPRSPKNKVLQGNIFLKCIESSLFLNSKDKFVSSSPSDTLKFDNSDKQKVKRLEVKAKSSSLGRFYTRHLSEIHSVNISLEKNDKTPVPPPRRRRKSVTDVLPAKELESKQDFYSHITSIKPQNSFPEYATVNYSQKKNRKNNSEGNMCSNDQKNSIGLDSEKNPNQETAVNSFGEDKINLHALKQVFETCNRPDVTYLSKEATKSNTSHSVNNEVQLSVIAADMDTAASTMLSETCRLDKDVSSNIDNSVLSTEFIKTDNEDKGTVTPENFSVCKSQCEDCPHTGEQDAPRNEIKKSSTLPNESDMCATGFQEKSMSDFHDSSSSSKVEWLSVNSSIRNSSNEVEKGLNEIDISSYKHRCEENINLLKENNNFSVLVNDSVDHIEISTSQKTYSDEISSLEICKTSSNVDTGGVCASSIGTNSNTSTQEKTETSPHQKFKYRSAESEKLIFRLLSDDSLTSSTPSLPCSLTHRNTALNRKHARRLSWSSCRDRVRAMRSEPRGRGNSLSLWYDDGDLSSGALADLDSSDNTARQSSLEDVFHGSEYDISKKSPHWNVCSKSERGLFPTEDCASISSSSQDNEYSLSAMKAADNTANRRSKISEHKYIKGSAHSDQEKTDITETSHNSDSEAAGHCKGEGVKLTSSEHKANKAFFIAKELMTSERVFISVLKLLNEDFRQALEISRKQHQSQIIPDDDFCKIFNSLPQLQSLNEDLLHDLECRIENWQSSKKIADVIVRKGPFLKLYTTYIQNFEAQCNHFDECCQKYPKFFKLVRDFEALPLCQKLSIKHFMLKPVQRIPQYRLLLDDYSRQLDSSSPDYEDTQRALKIVCDVADHANRSIKLGDHLSKLLQLQAQLNNYEIIKPGRIFLKEGELLKLSRKDSQPRYFILLNDCLLYTSYYGSGLASGLKVNSELPLGGMKVTTPQAEEFHNEFSIISSTRSFTLMARSQEERQEWVDALQAAIKDYTYRQLSFHKLSTKDNDNFSETLKLGKEVPVWIQDGRVTKCQCCVAVFTVTFRRHHCRACGKVVCSNCSDFRAPLQYKRFQPDRVCVDCYDTLYAEFQNEGRMKHCIETELRITDYEELTQKYREIKSHFKKLGSNGRRKFKKYVPQRLLEVTANDTGSQMSGWLLKRKKNSWKRYWFVLKDQVLYVYKASEDVAALETVPVLGYTVEQMKEPFEGRDANLVFQLKHEGQAPLMFSADSEHSANRWISAVREATVLKE